MSREVASVPDGQTASWRQHTVSIMPDGNLERDAARAFANWHYQSADQQMDSQPSTLPEHVQWVNATRVSHSIQCLQGRREQCDHQDRHIAYYHQGSVHPGVWTAKGKTYIGGDSGSRVEACWEVVGINPAIGRTTQFILFG